MCITARRTVNIPFMVGYKACCINDDGTPFRHLFQRDEIWGLHHAQVASGWDITTDMKYTVRESDIQPYKAGFHFFDNVNKAKCLMQAFNADNAYDIGIPDFMIDWKLIILSFTCMSTYLSGIIPQPFIGGSISAYVCSTLMHGKVEDDT